LENLSDEDFKVFGRTLVAREDKNAKIRNNLTINQIKRKIYFQKCNCHQFLSARLNDHLQVCNNCRHLQYMQLDLRSRKTTTHGAIKALKMDQWFFLKMLQLFELFSPRVCDIFST